MKKCPAMVVGADLLTVPLAMEDHPSAGRPRLDSLAVIESLVEQIEARHAEAQAAMSDPDVIGDRKRLAEAGRQFRTLEPAARLAEEWRRARDDLAGAKELL